MTELTQAQRKRLFDALVASFPGWSELALMSRLQLGRNLAEISSPEKTIRSVVLDLMVWAESHGRLGHLTGGALAERPDNPLLKSFVAEMRAQAPPDQPPGTSYERLIWKAVEFAGTAAFRQAMIERERCVCRVESGQTRGTGFLVGRDLACTNYHVLQDAIEQRQSTDGVAFRFDYRESADGGTIDEGRVVTLAAGGSWLVRSSRPDDLDYAIVRLAEPAGDDTLAGTAGAHRGWLSVAAHTFEVGEAVFILQHPMAAPLKIAAGGVSAIQERRVFYLANTLPGSSGSPCFTAGWQLAALHSSGDEAGNVGVPFSAILADLRRDPPLTLT